MRYKSVKYKYIFTYPFMLPVITVAVLLCFIAQTYASSVVLSPGQLNLLGPDGNSKSYHINFTENHSYRLEYTMPVLKCFADGCSEFLIDWRATDGSYIEYWGAINGSDETYRAGSLYARVLTPDDTSNFFIGSNDGSVDIVVTGLCYEEDGITWVNCFVPDFQIVDLGVPTPTVQPSGGTTANKAPINIPTTKSPSDKTPPTINLTADIPKIVKTFPSVSGTATDNVGVLRIEYSTDGGTNWLPADGAQGLGSKQVSFSFTPPNLDDGNYKILVRAIDGSGNIAVTNPAWVVVDRLPSTVGGQVISLGPQILEPNDQGIITSTVGIGQKITLSVAGGPTAINLTATPLNATSPEKDPTLRDETKNLSLTQSPDTGLWYGVLSFEDPGVYSLFANAVDGARNKTSRQLAVVDVAPAGKIVPKNSSQGLSNAQITIYRLDPESNDWGIWDSGSYGQTNPQTTGQNGSFNFFLPAGKYYLKTKASGYKPLTSEVFEIKRPTPLSAHLNMERSSRWLGWLGWFDFKTEKLKYDFSSTNVKNELIGQAVPTFSLDDSNGAKINSIDWLGKPTLLSFNATWSTATDEQLGPLSQLQSNHDINIVPIGLEQGSNKLKAYNNIAGLNLIWLADPDGTLSQRFGPQNLPTNFFVDRKGIIRQVIPGTLSKQDILNKLSSL